VIVRLLVYGGRAFGRAFEEAEYLREQLSLLLARTRNLAIITGAAGKFERDGITVREGADLFAWEWAVDNDVFWVLHPADWDQLCRGCDVPFKRCGPALWKQQRKCCPDCSHDDRFNAGPVRNLAMGRQWQPHRGVEFPGGSGTWNMRKVLIEAGIPTGGFCLGCGRIQPPIHVCGSVMLSGSLQRSERGRMRVRRQSKGRS
jgi:hypothetical protein